MLKLFELIKGKALSNVATAAAVAKPVLGEQKETSQSVAVVATVASSSAAATETEHAFPENEASLVRQWLAFVGEEDPETIAYVMACCRHNLLDRDYFLRRAYEEIPEPTMRACRDCRHLKAGQCDEVPLYEMPRAQECWRPDPTILRRCYYFTPKSHLKD